MTAEFARQTLWGPVHKSFIASMGMFLVSGTRKNTNGMERTIIDAKKMYTPKPMVLNICGVKRVIQIVQNQFEADVHI